MKYSVYVLQNPSDRLYIGSTDNLKRRLEEHNVTTDRMKWTHNRGPWHVVYTESYETRSEAMKRERFLKSGKGRELLKQLLSGCGAVG